MSKRPPSSGKGAADDDGGGGGGVISLLDDDDDSDGDYERAQISEAVRLSLADSHSRNKKRARLTRPSPRGVDEGGVISLLDSSDDDDNDGDEDDDDDGGGKMPAVGPGAKPEAKKTTLVGWKSSSSTKRKKKDDDDDDIQVVAPQAPTFEAVPPAAAAASSSSSSSARRTRTSPRRTSTAANDDDEIEAVGATNVLRLPHMRQHCPEHTFVPDVLHKKTLSSASAKRQAKDGLESNRVHCDLCFCFVCDVPAKECENWKGDEMTGETCHCLASDRGVNAYTWKKLRDDKKGGGTSTTASSSSATPAAAAASHGPDMTAIIRNIMSSGMGSSSSRVRRSSGGSSSGFRNRSAANRRRRVQENLEMIYGSRPSGSSSTSARASPARGSSSSSSRSSAMRERLAAIMSGARGRPQPEASGFGCGSSSSLSDARAANYRPGKGPFPPTDAYASEISSLTQCRKCKWRSAFDHRNFTRTSSVYRRGRQVSTPYPHDVGDEDWCHACGRIASTNDFGKEQSEPYRPASAAVDVLLGVKVIPFTLRSHDPRKMEPFKKHWEDESSEEWTYDEAEMDHDLFRHRLGEYPTLDMILASIPVVSETDIPDTGEVSNPLRSRAYSFERAHRAPPSANETEAVLLNSRNHRVLFEELAKFGSVGRKKEDGISSGGQGRERLGGDIRAKWDKERRKGTFTVRIYLRPRAFERYGASNESPESLSLLLGAWFDVFPFSLADLTSGLRAKESNMTRRDQALRSSIPIPPWRFRDKEDRDRYCTESSAEKRAIAAHNKSAKAIASGLSFHSSASSSSGGGVCSNDTSFSGTLRRYFSERIPQDCHDSQNLSDMLRHGWAGQRLGIVSHHRDMQKAGGHLGYGLHTASKTKFASYLAPEDHALLTENARSRVSAIYERTKTFPGLMQDLENLGHRPAPHTEGINVELLDFQRQAVGWAIERENTPGGLQSFLWTELPREADGVKAGSTPKLYFSPVLDMFATEKPKIARGGFLCEQMGLGKTVISLALVLQNPAPAQPASGTRVDRYDLPSLRNTSRPGWTPIAEQAERPAGAPKKRGSIYSRGTLVVCNVSLVGQWIDEAKSKLKDPGLVYSYHGSSRSRDASVLAQKSIVVTTYATLSSDATFHSKKANSSDYCAPCEQVRWWRIICDESHVMRSNTMQTRALANLEGECKWCVTGTPINTSIADLKNQMAFLKIEHLGPMFSSFLSKMGHHNGMNSSGRRARMWGKAHEIGDFMFVMRSIMMRHTMEQKCRQTKRDLMSLPPKEEKSIIVPFSAEERVEYDKLEAAALAFYRTLKGRDRKNLNKHYLRMFSALLPLRIACSGGSIPDGDPYENDDDGDEKLKVHQMDADDDIECSICLETLEEPRATQCKPVPHIFCKECIQGVIGVMDESTGPCPICRVNVQVSKLTKAILPKVHKEEVDCKHEFASKFKRLLKELKKVRDEDPTAKSLVFSQFTSTLEWLKEELPRHGFQYRTLAGNMPMSKRAKALREFQNDPPTTIFLLSMRAGAVGINLTQANRVFLMEPAVNPALEAQAIGRVHRLGQRHKVEVVRLVMENSVETRLVKLLQKKFGAEGNVTEEENGSSSDDGQQKNGQNGDTSAAVSSSKKSPSKPAESCAAIGSLRRDKTQMAEEEFDLLFGAED